LTRDTVFLTGASGFVGGHVLDALLERGYAVRALVRDGGMPARERCEQVHGDLATPGSLVPALRGCRYVVHAAAVYSFAPRDRAQLHAINVGGTTGLLEAARIAGVERAVVTSSSAAVGPARGLRPARESDWASPHHAASAYHASKVLQERAALAARIPVVTVLPTAPIGRGDTRPTPTGRMVLDVMRGRMPAFLAGGMNVVDVADVGSAHVLALEHGKPRERYIAGGVNLSLAELFALIARAAGRRAPRLRMPYPVALAAAAVDEVRSRVLGAPPRVPLEGVRMGRLMMYSSSEKAAKELGYRPHPIAPAIDSAVRWYRDHGYAA
jgi:dihydroflavonol-4-reductase